MIITVRINKLVAVYYSIMDHVRLWVYIAFSPVEVQGTDGAWVFNK